MMRTIIENSAIDWWMGARARFRITCQLGAVMSYLSRILTISDTFTTMSEAAFLFATFWGMSEILFALPEGIDDYIQRNAEW